MPSRSRPGIQANIFQIHYVKLVHSRPAIKNKQEKRHLSAAGQELKIISVRADLVGDLQGPWGGEWPVAGLAWCRCGAFRQDCHYRRVERHGQEVTEFTFVVWGGTMETAGLLQTCKVHSGGGE